MGSGSSSLAVLQENGACFLSIPVIIKELVFINYGLPPFSAGHLAYEWFLLAHDTAWITERYSNTRIDLVFHQPSHTAHQFCHTAYF